MQIACPLTLYLEASTLRWVIWEVWVDCWRKQDWKKCSKLFTEWILLVMFYPVKLYQKYWQPESTTEKVGQSLALWLVQEKLATVRRMSKLWLQYMECADIMKQFIRVARSGIWNLYPVIFWRMINIFAAAAHPHYVKSAQLYLQTMLELSTKYPWAYTSFAEHGYHTVRRTEKFWTELWKDLITEWEV